MATVTVPKTEYERLQRQAKAYRRMATQLFESVLDGSVEEVVEDFRQTNLYDEEFLHDLSEGLKISSYGKQHGRKAAQK